MNRSLRTIVSSFSGCLALVLCAWLLAGAEISAETNCCKGQIGNVDQSVDERMDVGDLALLIDYLFVSLAPLPCPEEANLDQSPDGVVDITDLTLMVEHLFITLAPEPSCVDFPNFVPDYIRLRVMHSAESAYAAIDWTNLTSGNAALRNYLKTVPEILAADTLGGAVWAIYTDSVMHIFSHNFQEGTPPSFPSPPAISEPRPYVPKKIDPTHVASLELYEMPSSTKVRLIKTVGDFFDGINGELAGWFNSKGYTVSQTSGSVEDFKSVGGEGFFYFHGHGDAGVSPDGTELYALWTTTPSDGNNPPSARAADLKANRLVLYTADDDRNPNTNGPIGRTHYAFTEKFVSKYWSDFSDNSIVWINACSSGGPLGASFADSILARHAGLYFGWTKPVNSLRALFVTEVMLDGMLGTNSVGTPPTPPNRPFDYQTCYEYLVEHNLQFQPGGGGNSEFVSIQGAGNAGILLPSIEVINLTQTQFTVSYLSGQFGSEPTTNAELLIGGQPISDPIWTSQLIFFNLPDDGPSSAGDVLLRVPDENGVKYRESNVVPITRWTIPFTYKLTNGSATLDVTYDMEFRADVHPFRDKLNGDTFESILTELALKPESPITFEGSGTNTQSPNPDYTVITTWNASCAQILGTVGPGLSHYNPNIDNLDLIHHKLTFSPGIQIECGTFKVREERTGQDPVETTESMNWTLENDIFDDQQLEKLTLSLTDTYEINGGNRISSDPHTYGSYPLPIGKSAILSWSKVTPEFPPDKTTIAVSAKRAAHDANQLSTDRDSVVIGASKPK